MKKKFGRICFMAGIIILFLPVHCKKTNANYNDVIGGFDFINEARNLYVTAACGEFPDLKDISKPRLKHCEEVKNYEEIFNRDFTQPAEAFFKNHRPAGISKKIIYPFGGCDLISALVTFPDAEEITTISLEGAGNPEGLSNINDAEKEKALEQFRPILKAHLMTKNTSNASALASEVGVVPGQLGFSLVAAKIKGYQPISLRYFRIEPDGSLYYFNKVEIEKQKNQIAKKLKMSWVDAGFSVAFRNMEIIYKNNSGRKLIHRHIGWNLDNKHFGNSGLHKFLKRQGKISTMTKAASYLVWFDSFSAIRNYMLENSDFMVSDATGILPRHAEAGGFRVETYGKFTKAFLDNGGGTDTEEFRNVFLKQPARKLGFFYGHADANGNSNLILYYKAE